ncbi:hypothetical protein C8R45DRAFT_1033910 [Mycena sanguinolenta]|nr:hypothetical protein C8R45DRAFT_1033910 [Mycena sanguinolenta]
MTMEGRNKKGAQIAATGPKGKQKGGHGGNERERRPRRDSDPKTSWNGSGATGSADHSELSTGFNGGLNDKSDTEPEPGTFVIYLPQQDGPPRTLADSFTTNDLTGLQPHLGLGGLVSFHDPREAASWIEDHWNNDILASIRHGGWGGPLSCMLSPEEPALAIFGSYEDPTVVNMAKSLAEASGFPVVIRPNCDDPALTLLSGDIDPHIDSNNNPRGGNSQNRESSEGDGGSEGSSSGAGDGSSDGDLHEQQPNGDGAAPGGGVGGRGGGQGGGNKKQGPSRGGDARGRGGGDGGGDGAPPTTVDDQWESPLHSTCVKLALKPDADRTYAVAISYTFKFTINRDTNMPIDLNDLSRPLSQPEIISALDFEIETRPRETQVDRSHASIGFVVHREKSIARRKFLHRGFDLPLKLYKRSSQRQSQRGFQGAFGLSQGPLSAATLSYTRTNGTTLEATDNKVMPTSSVKHETGDAWDKDKNSYSSYNVVYQVQNPELDAQLPDNPLEVRVGMGINLRPPGSKTPLPKISFVNRNQVLIWVSDPTSKARVRGIMVLMTSYLDNIRTEEELSIYEEEMIKLGSLKGPQVIPQESEAETISLAIAQVQMQAAPRFSKLRGVPLFSTKLGQRSSVCPLADIRPHEYLARGWDANNNKWRQVLWPALDKDFRAADFEGKSPVWKIQCPWKDSATNGVYTSP